MICKGCDKRESWCSLGYCRCTRLEMVEESQENIRAKPWLISNLMQKILVYLHIYIY
jgi:hypothetical protein